MKERGRSRVRPLPSYPDQPHYNEVNSVHHYMLVLNKYNPSQSEMQVLSVGNDSNLLIVFYVQIMPDDFVMQLHRF